MAAKKPARKGGKKSGGTRKLRLVPGDPPIIVGGGGSSLVWIRKNQEPQLIEFADVPGSAPQPANPGLYYIFKVKDSHISVVVDDGNSPAPTPETKPVHEKKHSTWFVKKP